MPGLVGQHDRLDAVAEPELHEHAGDVGLDRRLGDDQLGGDLGVREAAGDELEDLELAGGELVEAGRGRAGGRAGARELLDQPAGDRRREQGVAAGHDADAVRELLGRDVLEQEPGGARAQRVVDVLVEVEGREHQDLRAVAGREHAAGRLDAVELGHADVHQHDVGGELARLLDRLQAVGGLADDVEVVLGVEDHPEARAHERLVVGDQHPHRAHAAASTVVSSATSGSFARIRKPPPRRRPASSSPP